MARPVSKFLVLLLSLGVFAPRLHARTFIVPHVFEVQGSVVADTYTFDSTLWMVYTAGLIDNEPISNATVDLYLLKDDGTPILGVNLNPVCNPCSFNLNGATRKVTAAINDLIANAGGPNFGVKTGFALFEMSGDDDHVAIGMSTTNSHSSPFDLDTFFPAVTELPGGLDTSLRLVTFPHVLEAAGTTVNTQYAFDTIIYAAYAGGVAGSSIPAGSGAYVSLYLFDNDGTFMQGLSGDVCAPCVESISSVDPKAAFNIDALISNAGGPNFGVKTGFGLIVISGTADAVALHGVTINSHTSPFDLSMADLKWEEVPTSGRPTATSTPAIDAFLRSYPNPSTAATTRIDYSLPRDGSATLEIVDVQGRVVARPVNGHQNAGEHHVDWNGRGDDGQSLPSGIYFARLVTDSGVRALKLTIVR
jgi:hypothetical protein